MFLSRENFAQVLRDTPLVSIDLIVRDECDRVLLGLRLNRPARGSWFVPGGRIYKDERIEDAFLRISYAELGRQIPWREAIFFGLYQHLYDDNALGVPGLSTHYVVAAYQLQVAPGSLVLPGGQHDQFRWMDADEICNDPAVHPNTQAYFASSPWETTGPDHP